MNKADLSNQLKASFSGVDNQLINEIVTRTFELIGESLGNNEKVQIFGFGTFDVRERSERQGVNPRTKEAITIPASKSVGFKASKTLKDKVNG